MKIRSVCGLYIPPKELMGGLSPDTVVNQVNTLQVKQRLTHQHLKIQPQMMFQFLPQLQLKAQRMLQTQLHLLRALAGSIMTWLHHD